MALDVGGVEDLGVGRLSTETTSCLLTKIDEVLTPDLNGSVTILGTVARVERIDLGWLIVLEIGLIDTVSEVASHRDRDSDPVVMC